MQPTPAPLGQSSIPTRTTPVSRRLIHGPSRGILAGYKLPQRSWRLMALRDQATALSS